MGQTRQTWQTTPRCRFGFSRSAAVKSFVAFFTCSSSNFTVLNASLHRGHVTVSTWPVSFWWSAHTFMQEIWTLLPQPNLVRDEDGTEQRKIFHISLLCLKDVSCSVNTKRFEADFYYILKSVLVVSAEPALCHQLNALQRNRQFRMWGHDLARSANNMTVLEHWP